MFDTFLRLKISLLLLLHDPYSRLQWAIPFYHQSKVGVFLEKIKGWRVRIQPDGIYITQQDVSDQQEGPTS